MPSPARAPEQFPVVGIGASAGGLDALQRFFGALPENSGMAFVVIQHMAPDSDSMLSQLLDRRASIPVLEAREGMGLEINMVCVIPPDRNLELSGGILHLRETGARHSLTVDTFLCSLAADIGPQAVAVILSGTGMDGSVGARAVAAEGGLVLAQSTETSEYAEMPGHVIDTGLADFILPPEQMPAALMKYQQLSRMPDVGSDQPGEKASAPSSAPSSARASAKSAGKSSAESRARTATQAAKPPDTHASAKALDKAPPEASAHASRSPAKNNEPLPPGHELAAILALLHQRTGHDFSQYKTNTLMRRVARRMVVHGIDAQAQYVALLRKQPAELDRLFGELLIRVSSFFRDPEAFQALESKVIPTLFKDRSMDQPIRVWVPGCSTGEEAYSIAILIAEAMERMGRRFPVQIFATDIDTRALDIARAGRYPDTIAANVSGARLKRYFTHNANQYEISKDIRELLVFAEQSISKDPPFSKLDLVSCRNLLIYMGSGLQQRIMPVVHYALKPGGHLFLGTAESIGHADDLLSVVDRKWNIYKRRDNAYARKQVAGLQLFMGHEPAAATPHPKARQTGDRPDPGDLTRQLLLRNHTPPAVLINAHNQIQFYQGRTGRFLEPASGAPTQDLMRMIRPDLERSLRTLVHRARTQRQITRGGAVCLNIEGKREFVRLTASPVDEPDTHQGSLLVLLESLGPADQQAEMEAHGQLPDSSTRVAALEQELASTNEALQSSIEELETSNEELQSSNEELQSSNEELQSSNEELETSREELHSVNEELHAVNAKLEDKISELSRTNDDINNLLGSTDIGIVFIDNKLRIERFTPAATAIIPLIDGDLGRPIDHLAHNLDYAHLPQDIHDVLQKLVQKEHEIRGRDGRWYLVRIRPYRSVDNRINGAVLAFVDITEEKSHTLGNKLQEALDQLPGMVMLTDLDGRIEYANDAFKQCVGRNADQLLEQVSARDITRMDKSRIREMHKAIRAGKTCRCELALLQGNGGWMDCAALFAPIRDSTSEITHAVAYFEEPSKKQ